MLLPLLCLGVVCVQSLYTEANYDILEAKVENLLGRYNVLKEENDALKTELHDLSQYLREPCVFSAVKTSIQAVLAGGVIKFNDVLIDTHDLHNPGLGILTIPETAIYEITVTLFKQYSSIDSSNEVYADLYADDTQLTRILIDYSNDTAATAHSTSSIIREFTIGDTVHVRAGVPGTFYGNTTYNGSQFSLKYLGAV